MPEEIEGPVPEEEVVESETVEETTFSEEETPAAPDPEPLTEEEVSGVLDSTQAEVTYVKELTGSGKPFAQGASQPPENKPRSDEERLEGFNKVMREVGLEEV